MDIGNMRSTSKFTGVSFKYQINKNPHPEILCSFASVLTFPTSQFSIHHKLLHSYLAINNESIAFNFFDNYSIDKMRFMH